MRSRQKSTPTVPPGLRIYAIGDVHGEGDLLRRALQLIQADSAARREETVTLVFLGDIIDRGPEAADLLRTFARLNAEHVVVLKGNHEAALVQAYHGDHEVLSEWLPFGATATLTGFGVTPEEIDSEPEILSAALRARIDPELIDWIDRLPSAWECGDYYFTHAGVRPGVKLHKQDDHDLLWIREPFLSSGRWHGKVVVHGHTIEPGEPSLGGNRIGIDTGAHEHGVLTVLGLEGGRQWLLQSTADQPEHDATSDRATSGRRSTAKARAPAQDIAALIAAIVAPEPEPRDTVLLLKTPAEPDVEPDATPRRRKRLGTRGVAAAGFALIVAAVGGVIAIGVRHSPFATGGVSMFIPDAPRGEPTSAPAARPTTTSLVANKPRVRAKIGSRAGGTAAAGASPRMYGAELERALEEDRAATRRLNQEELSRPPAPAPSPAKSLYHP